MKTAKVIDHPNLIRDLETNAILNTDMLSVRKHEKRILDLQKEKEREADINNMKNELSEIKMLLRQLSNSSFVKQ